MFNGRYWRGCCWTNRFVLLYFLEIILFIDISISGSLQEVFGTPDLWHVALSVYVVLVIVCMLPYYWFPESPKYLFIIVKDHEAAKNRKFDEQTNLH